MKNPNLEKLKAIDTELDKSFKSLYKLLKKEYKAADNATAYLFIKIINAKLNALKALEYHYRDSGENGRIKSKYPAELKTAHSLLKKYSENVETENSYSDLQLKEKFDDFGVLASKNRFKKKK